MAFHRLVVPTYFGGLPAGYDYINNATAGTPAPANGQASGGPNLGTYFVAFGEDATSADLNRPARALAENCDYLDDLLRRDLASPIKTDDAVAGGGGVTSITLTGPGIFVGEGGTPNTVDGIRTFVQVVDETDSEIYNGGNECQVTAISPETPGDGFSAGNVALTISPAIPSGKTYRVYYYVRSSLAAFTAGVLQKARRRWNFSAAVLAEATARAAADASEATTRAADDASEASARAAADSALDTRVTALEPLLPLDPLAGFVDLDVLDVPADVIAGINGPHSLSTTLTSCEAVPFASADGYIQSGNFFFQTASTSTSSILAIFPLHRYLLPYNGRTIVSVTLYLCGQGGHGALPAQMPRAAVRRSKMDANELGDGGWTNGDVVACRAADDGGDATTWATDSAANTAAYEVTHTLVVALDQNNVVDLNQYAFDVLVRNEGSTNALVGLRVAKIRLTFS